MTVRKMGVMFMKIAILNALVAAFLFLTWPSKVVGEPIPFNPNGVVAMVNADGLKFAHGCPISSHRMLTAEHVAAIERPWSWQGPPGWSGVVEVETIDGVRELASMVSEEEGQSFPISYSISPTEPSIGDTLWMVGFGDIETPLAPAVKAVKVTSVAAGYIFTKGTAGPGSSGSCLFNRKGEVVGINIATIGTQYGMGTLVLSKGNWGEPHE